MTFATGQLDAIEINHTRTSFERFSASLECVVRLPIRQLVEVQPNRIAAAQLPSRVRAYKASLENPRAELDGYGNRTR